MKNIVTGDLLICDILLCNVRGQNVSVPGLSYILPGCVETCSREFSETSAGGEHTRSAASNGSEAVGNTCAVSLG